MRELFFGALVLACPLMMFFMMRGHGHGHASGHTESTDSGREGSPPDGDLR